MLASLDELVDWLERQNLVFPFRIEAGFRSESKLFSCRQGHWSGISKTAIIADYNGAVIETSDPEHQRREATRTYTCLPGTIQPAFVLSADRAHYILWLVCLFRKRFKVSWVWLPLELKLAGNSNDRSVGGGRYLVC